MARFKCIVTATWSFETELGEVEALAYAKQRLGLILDASPQGDDFEGFNVQVELARLKDRKKLVHLGSFAVQDVLPFVTHEDSKRDYEVGGHTYSVRMNSDRYHVFLASQTCVACGLEGTVMSLDLNPGDGQPHFNLYAEENGRLVLMTKDHIVPKSKGGPDALENLQAMCQICNNLKGNAPLSCDQIRTLRQIQANANKLKRTDLNNLLNATREKLAQAGVD